jgi:hypothetical protein
MLIAGGQTAFDADRRRDDVLSLPATELHEVGNYPAAVVGLWGESVAVKCNTPVVDGGDISYIAKCRLLNPKHLPVLFERH